jgi:TRAP-type C4-dicarboxylate transport system permease small subunit
VEFINALVLCGFGASMAWYSTDLVIGTWNRQIPLLGLPQGLKYVPLVICGSLIVLFMLERMAGLLKLAPAMPLTEES